MRMFINGLLIVLLATVSGCGGGGGDPVISIEDDDPAMLAAMDQARQTAPEFITRLSKLSNNEQALVKVRIGKEREEHIWIDEVQVVAGRIHGKLANRPNNPGFSLGDPVDVAPGEISDWAILKRDGTYDGGFTMKVMEEKAGRKLH